MVILAFQEKQEKTQMHDMNGLWKFVIGTRQINEREIEREKRRERERESVT